MGKRRKPATFLNGNPKVGRPTRLTAKVQEDFCNAVSRGVTIQSAAAHAGVYQEIVNRWLARGALAKGGHYRAFRLAYERAWAEFELRNADAINKAALVDWKAGLAVLERRMPKDWGRTDKTQLTGADGAPLKIDIDAEIGHHVIADDEAIRIANDLLARLCRPADSGGPGAAPPG